MFTEVESVRELICIGRRFALFIPKNHISSLVIKQLKACFGSGVRLNNFKKKYKQTISELERDNRGNGWSKI